MSDRNAVLILFAGEGASIEHEHRTSFQTCWVPSENGSELRFT